MIDRLNGINVSTMERVERVKHIQALTPEENERQLEKKILASPIVSPLRTIEDTYSSLGSPRYSTSHTTFLGSA